MSDLHQWHASEQGWPETQKKLQDEGGREKVQEEEFFVAVLVGRNTLGQFTAMDNFWNYHLFESPNWYKMQWKKKNK